MMKTRVVGVLVPMVLVAAAGAGVIRHDVDDGQYQSYANLSQFAAVGHLQMQTVFGGRDCSATLIDSQWALTAAHCFDGIPVRSSTLVLGSESRAIEEVVINPGWAQGQFLNGFDLALVRLAAPVTTIPVAQLYTGSGELGRTGSSVGFGRFGTGLTGDVLDVPGTKRAGTNVIDIFGTDQGWAGDILVTDFDNPLDASDSLFGDSSPTDLELQVAAGDSGGAMFIEENGSWFLGGVTSFIAAGADGNPNADYGDISAYTRVSAYTDWINSVVPAPGTGGVFAIGLLAVTRRRRMD